MAENTGSQSADVPKYALGDEHQRQNVMVGVSVAFTSIGMVCVGLRVYTRALIVKNIGAEDWTMVAAATLTLVMLFEIIAGAKEFKLGFSGSSMTIKQMQSNIQLTLAIILTYKTLMTLIKISIALIYLRFAVTKKFEMLCKGTICMLITYQFIVIVVVPAQCTPLWKLWDFTGQVQGRCINANDFFLATSVFHIIMDFWIIILPVKLFLSIPRPPREKLAVCFVFGLGLFSTICSIIRLQYLRLYTHSKDPFYDTLPINTWSMIEVNIGILCASLPTLRPLISKSQRDRTMQALKSKQRNVATSQRGLVVHARDITISTSSLKSAKSSTATEEYEMDVDIRPPVPPKEVKIRKSSDKGPWNAHRDLERNDPFTETIFLKLGR